MLKNMQILKLSGFSQSPTTTHATDDDVINDVVQYDYCEYGDKTVAQCNYLILTNRVGPI